MSTVELVPVGALFSPARVAVVGHELGAAPLDPLVVFEDPGDDLLGERP